MYTTQCQPGDVQNQGLDLKDENEADDRAAVRNHEERERESVEFLSFKT
jgi:hypothetical protein